MHGIVISRNISFHFRLSAVAEFQRRDNSSTQLRRSAVIRGRCGSESKCDR